MARAVFSSRRLTFRSTSDRPFRAASRSVVVFLESGVRGAEVVIWQLRLVYSYLPWFPDLKKCPGPQRRSIYSGASQAF